MLCEVSDLRGFGWFAAYLLTLDSPLYQLNTINVDGHL